MGEGELAGDGWNKHSHESVSTEADCAWGLTALFSLLLFMFKIPHNKTFKNNHQTQKPIIIINQQFIITVSQEKLFSFAQNAKVAK